MKKYLYDMTAEEIITRLENGEVIKNSEYKDAFYSMIKGHICSRYRINIELDLSDDRLYFDIEEETIKEPFEITETGLYKTRDGNRAFVAYIEDIGPYPVKGKIEGTSEEFSWTRKGYDIDNEIYNTDIVSKWE